MSYRLKVDEPLPNTVRQIAAEEIRSAVSHLRGKHPHKSDPASQDLDQRKTDIHEARKSIKRVRALLRLVRPELGTWFRRENAALRDIGRRLSDIRDSSIVMETFDSLSSEPAEHEQLEPVRSALQQQKKAKEKGIDSEATLRHAAESLHQVSERIGQWPFHSDGFDAIAHGLRAEYKDGRKAMSKALRTNDSLLFHEWRKRAKCQLYHLRFLKGILSDPFRQQEQLLHRLETALGDDHNLLILRDHLRARRGAVGGKKALGGKEMIRHSIDLVAEREKTLRTEAEALGEQIYTRKPKQFVEDLRADWEKAAATMRPASRKDKKPAA